MQKYTHLTLEQRYQISALLKSNISISEIAKQLGYHKSTIIGHDRRGQITHRKDISERPHIIEQQLGDYEGDTVVGKGYQGVLVTLVDRTTRETKIRVLANQVAKACIDMLKVDVIHSITFDNSKEFALHEVIVDLLNTQVYFARPYHSWERGTNENTNGLICQFLPKSQRFNHLTDEQIQAIEDNLNHRPRKVLGCRTPLEVKSSFGCVALQT